MEPTTSTEHHDPSDNPTGDLGDTEAAGAGLSDDQFLERVAGQTSSDLQAESVFQREADSTSTDAPVADVTADDLKS